MAITFKKYYVYVQNPYSKVIKFWKKKNYLHVHFATCGKSP